jgi:hypothetical protein
MFSMPLSSSALLRAADIVEEIEALQKQVSDLLESQDLIPEEVSNTNQVEKPSKTSSNGRRTRTERGTLRPAVLKVLKESKEPLKSSAIYERLIAGGYRFSFNEPKKVLQIRLYRMPGIKKAGKGLFKAK